MKKTWISATICALAISTVLAGCSDSSSTDSSTATPGSSAQATASGPVSIKVFADQDSASNQDLANSWFSKQLEQKFNIKFNWTTVPFDGAPEKRQISLASGDYPDLFLLVPYIDHFTQSDLLKYGQQGVVLPLNDLIDKYGPNIKKTLDAYPDYKAMNTAPDGKIYGLGQFAACYHCSFPNKMWVNSTWMKKLNISTPKTTDDFKKMLEAFKTKDPNGNGKADEIPLSGSIETFGVHVVPFLMNGFIYDDDHTYLVMDNGKVDIAANKPEWKEGLKYIKSLYDEGLIDPGAFTQNADAFKKIGENKDAQILGAGAGMHPAIFVDIADGNRFSKDYDSIPPIVGPGNVSYSTFSYAGNPGTSFVLTNKASKDVQIAAIKALDYMYTLDGQLASQVGKEDVDWRKPQSGDKALDDSMKPLYAPIPLKAGEKNLNNNWISLGQYLSDSNLRGSLVQSTDIYSDKAYERRLFEATKNNYDTKQPKQVFPYWALWIDPNSADQASMLQTNITNYVNQSALQFITGNKNLDKDWDAYVKGFDGLDLKSYLTIMQKSYDSSTYSKK
ncbi:ABC transporter substrate-binding protein [Paenibacillus pectinilyticus]|uniref:ABC transporter substrate-binding protein n=1 Tax=Paenibacillus pectinilyticus TaxID=512399 RepID=A0A1C0ZXT2_9BACL|nr:extracellular solute-binding protein [Paenibacillus pectinilyticus]OCT12907.1 ABC transporter substrate-binding protein [Paenibacillus pectinilyticus]